MIAADFKINGRPVWANAFVPEFTWAGPVICRPLDCLSESFRDSMNEWLCARFGGGRERTAYITQMPTLFGGGYTEVLITHPNTLDILRANHKATT